MVGFYQVYIKKRTEMVGNLALSDYKEFDKSYSYNSGRKVKNHYTYSYLNASIGSRFAALYAGYVPKISPTVTHIVIPIITQSIGIAD